VAHSLTSTRGDGHPPGQRWLGRCPGKSSNLLVLLHPPLAPTVQNVDVMLPSILSTDELATVSGGLGVRDALSNVGSNVYEWGRAVYGRQAELNKFAKTPQMSLDTYVENLKRYDAHYKPVIPTEAKW
jgi:hypothetical protein